MFQSSSSISCGTDPAQNQTRDIVMPRAHGLNLVRDITLTTLVGTAPSFLLLDRPATATVTTIVSRETWQQELRTRPEMEDTPRTPRELDTDLGRRQVSEGD
ncbi:hypothetical protein IG631_17932 [Alternaria alternata]|nr:hypothetical protein IG631_17932 [Alternaria alternata]